MTRSDTIGKLAADLAKAQRVIKGAQKDAKNPHFGSRYADLASVVEAAGPLADHGLAYLQSGSTPEPGLVAMVTTLVHHSGEWIESDPLTVRAKDAGPQAVGSCLTYLRRYQLMALVGIAPDDDDAEAAERRSYAVQPPAQVEGLGHSDYHSVQNGLSPAHPMPDGSVLIREVKTSPTKNPNVQKAFISLSTGEEVTTIKTPLISLCEQLCQEQIPVTVETKPTKWGTELIAVHRIPIDVDTLKAELSEPLDVSAIPF